MKTILFVLIISTLDVFITFSSCEDESLMKGQLIAKSYPRKLKQLQILNPTKFMIVKSNKHSKRNLKGKIGRKYSYTVFPTIANQKGIPDSIFFPPEHNIETKVRVKKVLPDYLFSISRKKRELTKDGVVDNIKSVTKRINKKKNKRIGDDTNKTEVQNIKGKKSRNSVKSKHKTKDIDTDDRFNDIPKHSTRRNSKHDHTKTDIQVKSTKKTRDYGLRAKNRSQKDKHKESEKEIIQKRHNHVEKNRKKKKRHNNKRHEEKASRRLIAGRDALIEEYPYVVSIQKDDEHWCAGALLNPRLVITTANCIWKASRVSRLRVRVGSRHADRGGQHASILEVMKHPRWSIRRNPDNDVALLLLDRNIRFSDKVHGVDLPNFSMMPDFDDAWVTSWGAERRDGIYRNTQVALQVYSARLLSREKCNNVTQRFGVTVTENFICLAQTGRRAPCTRDTGAPAVSDGILWGLASWGIRKLCGTERFPAVFSYTASPANLDFIKNATSYLMADKRHYPFLDRQHAGRADTAVAATSPKPVQY